MGKIQAGRHYEISSTELAGWLEDQGVDSWWNVDGDPLLTGRLTIPCPTDELSSELRRIDRPLLIQAPNSDEEARGQSIDAVKFDSLVTRFADDLHKKGFPAESVNDRFFYLCWKGSPHEWILAEDSVTARQYREEAAPKAK